MTTIAEDVLTKWADWAERGAKDYRAGQEATPFPSFRELYRREAEDREELAAEARSALNRSVPVFATTQQRRIYELAQQIVRYCEDSDYREAKERSAKMATDGDISWYEATCTEIWCETERMRIN